MMRVVAALSCFLMACGSSSGPPAGDDPRLPPNDAGDGSTPLLPDPPDASDLPGAVKSSAPAATQVDRVGPGDNGRQDGQDDVTIDAVVLGPIDGLILVRTDEAGIARAGTQWDTLVGNELLPDIGTNFVKADETWLLGVDENGTMVNDTAGHISLGAGSHTLTLTATATLPSGEPLRLYARTPDGIWHAGPIFHWH